MLLVGVYPVRIEGKLSLQELEAADHIAPTTRNLERGMLAATQLSLSVHTVQDRTQEMAPPTMGGAPHPN